MISLIVPWRSSLGGLECTYRSSSISALSGVYLTSSFANIPSKTAFMSSWLSASLLNLSESSESLGKSLFGSSIVSFVGNVAIGFVAVDSLLIIMLLVFCWLSVGYLAGDDFFLISNVPSLFFVMSWSTFIDCLAFTRLLSLL